MPGNAAPLERGLEEDTAPLWRALADPTRRRILDLLRERPRVTGEIAAQFPISRIAVMRHLEVLSEAGLAVSRKRGRQRWHYLNMVPLQKLHRRWADPAAAGFASALLRLQDTVEAEGRPMEPIRPTIDIAQDIEMAGTPAAVFAALTKDIGGWWGHPFVTARATSLALDARLGGLFAAETEKPRPRSLIADTTEFARRRADDMMPGRDAQIIPRYTAGGVTKSAFITGAGVPFPTAESGAGPAPEGPATFPAGWFASRDRACQWPAE